MSRAWLLVSSMLAVLAVSAVVAGPSLAASASASFELGGRSTDELAEQTTMSEPLVMEAEGQPTIECSKVQIKHGEVTNGSSSIAIGGFRFANCIDKSSETKCVVSTIETKAITDTLESEGKQIEGDTQEDFKPTAGTEFASFKLKNKGEASCGTTASISIGGDLVSKIEDNEKNEDTHKLNFNDTKGSDPFIYGGGLAAFHVGFGWYMIIPVVWSLLF